MMIIKSKRLLEKRQKLKCVWQNLEKDEKKKFNKLFN